MTRLLILFALFTFFISCTQEPKSILQLEYDKDELELFGPHFISTHLHERDIAIHPLGQELIYTLGNQKQSRRALVALHQQGKNWSPPSVLNISGKYQDIEPFYANDGNRLFFASNRPMRGESEAGDYNIWYADRDIDGWKSPIALDTIINREGDEFYPSLSANGNLYFTATREDGIGREDIFVSRFENEIWQKPSVLDSNINTKFYEFNAYIDPDETVLIFSSFGRPDGQGGGDLYYSIKEADGSWSKSKNMGDIVNSPQLDYCPFIDVENDVFYFTSERFESDNKPITVESLKANSFKPQNGFGDIYRIPMKMTKIR